MVKSSAQVQRELSKARSLYDQGKQEHNNEHYEAALPFFRQAVQVQESVLGKYHQDTIKSNWRLGRSACMLSLSTEQGNPHKEALQAFQRAARMAETAFDSHINRSLWKDLESCWREVHSSDDSELEGPSIEQIAQVLSSEREADAFCKKRNFAKAVELYQRALDIQDSLLGNDSLDGADIRCKLACCLLRLSKVQDAQVVLQTAHQCYVHRFGEQHPATLGTTANMKNIRRNMGKRNVSLSSLGSSSRQSITS